MFCLKCGEAIPDGSEICPKCGAVLKEKQQCVVYASQKEIENERQVQTTVVNSAGNRNIFALWGILAVLSFIFTAMNYMSVSIELLYSSSSDTNYSGYYLTKCLEGTARLSGIMVILLIIINITVIIATFLGIFPRTESSTIPVFHHHHRSDPVQVRLRFVLLNSQPVKYMKLVILRPEYSNHNKTSHDYPLDKIALIIQYPQI